MLGFFSKEKDDSVKVKKEEIFFISCSDNLNKKEIKMNFSKIAKTFAEKFNLKKVFLHTQKGLIIYDFKV